MSGGTGNFRYRDRAAIEFLGSRNARVWDEYEALIEDDLRLLNAQQQLADEDEAARSWGAVLTRRRDVLRRYEAGLRERERRLRASHGERLSAPAPPECDA